MSKFNFYTTKGNRVNWTEHCWYRGLVVLKKSFDGKWFLLRKKEGEKEQEVPLRDVPDRVKVEAGFCGRVFLNNETGKVSTFENGARDSSPRPRRHSSNSSGSSDNAAAAAAVGITIGTIIGAVAAGRK